MMWLSQLEKVGQIDCEVGMGMIYLACVSPRQGRLEKKVPDWIFCA